MSHITKIKTQLKDGQVLRKTLLKLGYHVKEGGMVSGGYGRDRKNVEILATNSGQAIGFRRSGSDLDPYEIISDWNGNQKKQHQLVHDIFQTYSQEKVMKFARSRGYSIITNHTNQNGQIEMVLRKVA
ncbi:MAG: hypothetical protein QG552_900 [Thermodesulfobacteriota bacterium]|nr:hypothetical protein [Thermodesulfobacteriota bacterium]